MEKKNINPESIEAFGKEKEQQQEQTVVNKFNEKNYLNVKLDTAKGELSKETVSPASLNPTTIMRMDFISFPLEIHLCFRSG